MFFLFQAGVILIYKCNINMCLNIFFQEPSSPQVLINFKLVSPQPLLIKFQNLASFEMILIFHSIKKLPINRYVTV